MSNPSWLTLINGQPVDTVEASNRGLQYGDGLFETLAIHEGQPQHWQRHWRRLRRGCELLGIPVPDEGQLADEAQRVSVGHARAVLKLILTRGGAQRGYRTGDPVAATRIWRAYPWPDYPSRHESDGVRVRVCHTPLARQPRLAGIKHLNRLEQVLARAEWQQEYEEGLMLDTEGHVVEGVSSNLFAVRQGRLLTPVLDHCGVEGITRERVLETATRLGLSSSSEPLRLDDLLSSDEVFLTNTLIGIWPVVRLDTEMPVSATHRFAVGAVTRRLQESLRVET